ncbi:MAG: hypothetical protein ETSY1_15395 [Candidatus Entotheonella factor]|uniref:Glycosyltransferase subfamily 4-like N-terminal domain-containing protein n=1 Tax=Entotheonella factor TaxID=1429438 RepID=W4LMN2_ENTF1|nr:MAG: hypothetical protein ETSY1_15395 [Candidatus Entotheonella factor]
MRVVMICPALPRADAPGSMAPTARQIQSLRDLGVEAEIVDMQGIPKLKYVQAIPRIRHLAASADLLHAHFGYCGWLARTAPRKPMVVSFMGDDLLGTAMSNGKMSRFSMAMARCNRQLARRAKAVIVKSGAMARVLAPWPSVVIPNGVDLDIFRPMDRQAARMALEMDDGRHKVLFPGNPDYPVKGFPLASAAVAVAEALLPQQQPIDLVPLWNVDPSHVPLYMNAGCHAHDVDQRGIAQRGERGDGLQHAGDRRAGWRCARAFGRRLRLRHMRARPRRDRAPPGTDAGAATAGCRTAGNRGQMAGLGKYCAAGHRGLRVGPEWQATNVCGGMNDDQCHNDWQCHDGRTG